jgi:hypothetical protein
MADLIHPARRRPPDKQNPAGRGGVRKSDQLTSKIDSDDSPGTLARQANYLTRRFRLGAECAHLIAGLAFAGGTA